MYAAKRGGAAGVASEASHKTLVCDSRETLVTPAVLPPVKLAMRLFTKSRCVVPQRPR
ncbi:hypothetical protein SBA3_1590004 [Candidatus Sulfopaludibacter sp. SbA3]|nr:hypothetical protein SBA3_1590004 [Candidatus Sulfopaludibacter sp. SbA3]